MKRFCIVSAILIATAASSWASNITNKDAKAYNLEITCDGATQKTSLVAKGKLEVDLEKGCVVKIANGASLTMTADKNVKISAGGLSEE